MHLCDCGRPAKHFVLDALRHWYCDEAGDPIIDPPERDGELMEIFHDFEAYYCEECYAELRALSVEDVRSGAI